MAGTVPPGSLWDGGEGARDCVRDDGRLRRAVHHRRGRRRGARLLLRRGRLRGRVRIRGRIIIIVVAAAGGQRTSEGDGGQQHGPARGRTGVGASDRGRFHAARGTSCRNGRGTAVLDGDVRFVCTKRTTPKKCNRMIGHRGDMAVTGRFKEDGGNVERGGGAAAEWKDGRVFGLPPGTVVGRQQSPCAPCVHRPGVCFGSIDRRPWRGLGATPIRVSRAKTRLKIASTVRSKPGSDSGTYSHFPRTGCGRRRGSSPIRAACRSCEVHTSRPSQGGPRSAATTQSCPSIYPASQPNIRLWI
ncbi:hypothetical protein BOSP111201_11850 [Bordetella sputigena]